MLGSGDSNNNNNNNTYRATIAIQQRQHSHADTVKISDYFCFVLKCDLQIFIISSPE